jgi:hypothetical protein
VSSGVKPVIQWDVCLLSVQSAMAIPARLYEASNLLEGKSLCQEVKRLSP